MQQVKEKLGKNIFVILLLLFSFIFSIYFVNNNYQFYDQPIAKVTQEKLINETGTIDNYENKDIIFKQELLAELKNGSKKGKIVRLNNEYSTSGAYDYPFRVGDELFITLDDQKDAVQTGRIKNIKRDKYILLSMWFFIFILLWVGKLQGFFATVSLALNILILSYALDLYVIKGMNLLGIFSGAVILFTVTSLLLVNGKDEKTYAAIITTLLGTFLSIAIAYLTMRYTDSKGLQYEEMSFITRPYEQVFFAGLFVGSLGAVMDVAISISSALYEMYQKDPDISVHSLKKSGFTIGKDIMGTMTNILFFAYISGSIPILIVYLKNGSPLNFTLSMNLSLEIARALIGGIGIVLAIPIGIYTTIFFIKRKKDKK